MADKIQKAYRESKDLYDDVLTQGDIFGKLYIKVFWSGTDDNEIARKVLSYIPDNFSGKLLEFLLAQQYSHIKNGKTFRTQALSA